MTMPRRVLTECHRLLSVRGEANSPAVAAGIVARLDALDDAQCSRFFERTMSAPVFSMAKQPVP